MEMKDVIREKRKELGLTQEQIADFLGVSTPAVNKWESGMTCPDVAILPALARLLKTDLNTLLCFRENLTQEDIGRIMNEIAESGQKEGVETAFKMIQQKVREYNSCPELLHSLATLLHGMMVWYAPGDSEKKKYFDYIYELYKRVEQCGDVMYASRARYMLASRLIQSGAYEEAQKLIDLMPEPNGLNKRDLQIEIHMQKEEYQEAGEMLEKRLQVNLQENIMLLNRLVTVSVREHATEQAWELAEYGRKIQDIYGLDYNSYMLPLTVAVEEKDADKCIELLGKMLPTLDQVPELIDSVLYRHIKKAAAPAEKKENTKFGAQMRNMLLTELEKGEQYRFLWEHPEFKRLLDEYRE